MEYEELTEKIIGAAYSVYNQMGFGFLESVYEKCLLIELEQAGLPCQSQAPIVVYYREHMVGNFVADLVVDNSVIVELKSVSQLISAHVVQLVNYLTATGLPVGLLLNFSESGVDIKRKVRVLPDKQMLPSSF